MKALHGLLRHIGSSCRFPFLTLGCALAIVATALPAVTIVIRHDVSDDAGATRAEPVLEPGGCSAPGVEPEPVRFLPGILSTPDGIEHGAVATPDGEELWFTRAVGTWGEPVERQTILVVQRRDDGSFGQAEQAPFSGGHLDDDPFPRPDGQWIYFVSDRPAPTKVGDGPDLWRVRRLGSGWGEPEHLAAVSSPGYEASPVVTSDGDLWFSSMREGGLGSGDLWRARSDGSGGFGAPENLGAPVNSDHGEWNLLVSPDARWIIFEASGRPENVTRSGDLYLTEKEGDGWSAPVNLRCLNSPGSDLLPRFGPSGRLLFASSRELDGRETDVFAVDLEVVLTCCADREPTTQLRDHLHAGNDPNDGE